MTKFPHDQTGDAFSSLCGSPLSGSQPFRPNNGLGHSAIRSASLSGLVCRLAETWAGPMQKANSQVSSRNSAIFFPLLSPFRGRGKMAELRKETKSFLALAKLSKCQREPRIKQQDIVNTGSEPDRNNLARLFRSLGPARGLHRSNNVSHQVPFLYLSVEKCLIKV